jgi:hypothetical protein
MYIGMARKPNIQMASTNHRRRQQVKESQVDFPRYAERPPISIAPEVVKIDCGKIDPIPQMKSNPVAPMTLERCSSKP